ncbi:voltage-gated ion channel superfamily [Reticulomyxa filosa]|uniref:Voltage-gated ion channel superfamily n=1 Tax=Reticulomyxa filosa TaxID=46433 RepID=X6P3B3_RETFI|nr:voltage-gated ion channel superfamily [Reticulomyxa filosa]|eukprot:ETO32618.1 voltage-gated ion channel superfamily [Reticulomyxa filosa]
MNKQFEKNMLLITGLNVVVMGMSYEGESDMYAYALLELNLLFTIVYFMEAMIKLIGFGGAQYFKNNWNRFEFAIMITTVAEVCLQQILDVASRDTVVMRVLRSFRALIVVRIIRRAGRLKILMKTLRLSLPSLAGVGGLLALVYFVFAILGMNLFGLVERHNCITYNANFETFWLSFLTMFSISTGINVACNIYIYIYKYDFFVFKLKKKKKKECV